MAAVANTDVLFAALGVAASQLPVEQYDNGVQHIYVGLASVGDVAVLRPDVGAVAGFAGRRVSAASPALGKRWKLRMFAPGLGVAEDAGTGSAASAHWLVISRATA